MDTFGASFSVHATEWTEAHWYAVYTCVRHEKTVDAILRERNVTAFLPLYETVHRWRDRRVNLQLPLFPGYIFVHLPLRDRLRVLTIPGVVHLVGAAGKPVPLPDNEIEGVRRYLESDHRAEPHAYVSAGRRVRIKAGPLEGCEGIVISRRGRVRIVIQVDLIQSALSVEVNAGDLECAEKHPRPIEPKLTGHAGK